MKDEFITRIGVWGRNMDVSIEKPLHHGLFHSIGSDSGRFFETECGISSFSLIF